MKEPQPGQEAAGADHSGSAAGSIVPLAAQINSLHHEVEQHSQQMLSKARAAGELLLEAKDSCKHGEWLNWIAANFEGSEKTAHNYMRVARRWSQIMATAKPQHVADLSIREALHHARYGYGRKTHNITNTEGRA